MSKEALKLPAQFQIGDGVYIPAVVRRVVFDDADGDGKGVDVKYVVVTQSGALIETDTESLMRLGDA